MNKPVRSAATAIAVAFAIAAVLAQDSLVLFACGLCLAVLVDRLWDRDNVPVLLVPLFYQWLQVATKPLEALFTGVPLSHLSEFGPPLEGAILLSTACLTALGLGLRAGLGHSPKTQRDALAATVNTWSVSHAATVCLSLMAVGYVADFLAYAVNPLRQPLLAVASLKYVGLFFLAFWTACAGRGRALLAAIVIVEIVSGLTGYFADFRGTLLMVFLGVIAGRPTLKPATVAFASVVGVVILLVAVFWSAVKPDYRSWVSGGPGAGQIVVRPISERFDYMVNAIQDFDTAQFGKGADALFKRLSYVDYISLAMLRVPGIIPHEDGKQIGQAIYHVFTPRALFPDKPPVPNDTEVTEYYTGLPLTATSENASISIGYVGELYIDFGFVGAIIAAGLVGLGLGWAARTIAVRPGNGPLIRYAVLIMVAMPLNVFEIALIKLIGASVTAVLAAWLLTALTRRGLGSSLLRPRTAIRNRLQRHP